MQNYLTQIAQLGMKQQLNFSHSDNGTTQKLVTNTEILIFQTEGREGLKLGQDENP